MMMITLLPSRRPSVYEEAASSRAVPFLRGLQRLPHVGYRGRRLKIGEWPHLSIHEFAFRMLKEALLVSVNLFF